MRAMRKLPAYLVDQINDGPPMLAGVAMLGVVAVAFWGGVAALII